MATLKTRLKALEVVHGGQYLPCCIIVPDPGEHGRDEVLAQVQRLRKRGRIELRVAGSAQLGDDLAMLTKLAQLVRKSFAVGEAADQPNKVQPSAKAA